MTSQTFETLRDESLVGVNGSPFNTVGHTTLTLTLNEMYCIAHFIVVDETVYKACILRIDFMKKHHCNIGNIGNIGNIKSSNKSLLKELFPYIHFLNFVLCIVV